MLCSHHGCSCGGGLRGHSCLVGLVLGGLNLGLQVGRRVEVLALLAGAAALDVVHADGDRVVTGVDHGTVAWVGEAAVGLAASAVAALELAANLGAGESRAQANRHTKMHRRTQMWTDHADVCMQKEKTKKYKQRHRNCEYLSSQYMSGINISQNHNTHCPVCNQFHVFLVFVILIVAQDQPPSTVTQAGIKVWMMILDFLKLLNILVSE